MSTTPPGTIGDDLAVTDCPEPTGSPRLGFSCAPVSGIIQPAGTSLKHSRCRRSGCPPGVEAVPTEIVMDGETMTRVELASRVSVFLVSRLALFALCVAVPLGLGWLVGWLCS